MIETDITTSWNGHLTASAAHVQSELTGARMTIKAEVLSGPFDPGGQPESRSGQPVELGLFGWNIKNGLTVSKAVLANPERYSDYWKWPTAKRLVTLAEEIGFEYQVQFARWIAYGGASGYGDANMDFASAAAAASAITVRILHFSTVH